MTSRADTEKRQAAVADLTAVLAARLPDADLEALTDQVAVLHLTTPQTRAVIDHLRVHPDALTSGSSAGPPGLSRLLDTLADRHPSVHRMRCGRCGAERRLPYRRDGARICTRCYSRAHLKSCVRCGELGHPIFREGAGTVCSRCSAHDPDRHDPCTGCGKPTRVAYRGVPPQGGFPLKCGHREHWVVRSQRKRCH